MWDLELSVIHKIYDIELYIFQKNFNETKFINKYGNTNNDNILTLCYVNGNHYTVLYENNKKNNKKSNSVWNDISYLIKDKNDDKIKFSFNISNNGRNFIFANDTRKIKYRDIHYN